MSLKRTDQSYLIRDAEPEDVQLTRSDGAYVFDAKGKKYIDFVSGWCVGNLGWGQREIRKAIRRYRGPDYVAPFYLYRPWVQLAKMLARITPGDLKHCVRATGGTEAVDLALQAAMLYKGRRAFVAIEGSYHGNSIGTLSIASSENRKQFTNLLPHCHKINPPLNARAIDQVERHLKRRDVAAFLMEPIICNLAVMIPEKQFMTELQRLCRRYDTLLIMDEVACGFGRTGKLFACEHFGIEPDILCMAKAITGGYAGMGATIMTDKVAKAIEGDFGAWSTYGWHALGVDAAIANIRYLIKHKVKLLANVNEMGRYFNSRLRQMKFKSQAEIHVKGMAIGIEFDDDSYATKLNDRCRQAGLLVNGDDDALLMFPPLTLDRKTAQRGLDILEDSL